MKKLLLITVLILLLLMLMGCTSDTGIQINTLNAPGANPSLNTVDAHGKVGSILVGVWHGFISPGTLVVSLFNSNVQMYEVHNDGGQYNFGFLAGIAIIFVVIALIFGRRRRLPL